MATSTMFYLVQTLMLVSFFAFIRYIWWRPKHSCVPACWPVMGMLPGVLRNALDRFHEFVTDVLKETGGTFRFRGPYFANMNMLVTSDPANIHYILSRNFSNYPKGPSFKRIFGELGEGIFISDSNMWEIQRRMAMKLLHHNQGFKKSLVEISWDKVQNGLMPLLDHASKHKSEIDLQDFLQRYTFDTTSILVLGQDPVSLCLSLPYNPCQNALGDAEEAVLYRHILPDPFWRLQHFLGVGKERIIIEGFKILDLFVARCISTTSSKSSKQDSITSTPHKTDLLTCYMKEYDDHKDKSELGDRNNFLRDCVINLLFAGKSTIGAALSWFFWLVATNPLEESKIREEIVTKLHMKENFGDVEELNKLVYLHGAICEALRLYPPVALQHKAPSLPDVLPSGEKVDADTRIILSFYSMGRMETIWGPDCLEFKPRRWISHDGSIKREPSSKFTVFNAGPRTCLGKDMTFIQIKIVAAALIYSYHFEVVEGHRVVPRNSFVIHMRDGLKVRVTKR